MNNQQTAPTSTSKASPEFYERLHLGQPWGATWLRFQEDMHRLGLDVHECAGAGGWGGPAVTTKLAMLPEIVAATKVEIDHHQVGDLVMVYPATAWI